MADRLNFELVSPERLLVSKQAAMVTIPGGEGDYGVLAGHAPMITTVRPGVIEIYADNDNTVTDRLFVAGGFAEVTEQRCTLLAEIAMSVAEIDPHKAEEERQGLLENYRRAETDNEREELRGRLAIAEAKIAACAPVNH